MRRRHRRSVEALQVVAADVRGDDLHVRRRVRGWALARVLFATVGILTLLAALLLELVDGLGSGGIATSVVLARSVTRSSQLPDVERNHCGPTGDL